MIYDHHYWHSKGVTDVEAMRKEAALRRKGGYYSKEPQTSIIHFHSHGTSCDNEHHEAFLVEEEAKDGQTTSE